MASFSEFVTLVMTYDYQNRSTDELTEELAALASDRGDALRANDPKRANARFQRMAGIYQEIRNRGIAAQRRVLSLLDNKDPYVRLSAATYALEFGAQRALPVLQEIDQKEPGTLGFTAGMTLKQWKKGELRFP
jgi:HEAT repeat protein